MGKAIATHKKAYRDYFLSEAWECGMALKGGEVKSIRAGKVNFKDSFARVDKGEVYLYHLHVDQYPQASYLNDDPDRARKLLLHKREIKKIINKTLESSATLVPTKIYFNKRGIVKVEIALAKGKRSYDKRDTIKKRDTDRDISRALCNRLKK